MRQSRVFVVVVWLFVPVLFSRADEPPIERQDAASERATTAANTPAAIAAAISRLDDSQFTIREEATKQLAHLGIDAIGPLSTAAAGDNLEVTWRAIKALERILDTDDDATFDAAEGALERLETSTNRSAARRAAAAVETQPERRWQRGLARLESAEGWAVLRKAEGRGGNGQAPSAAIELPTYLVIGPNWKGGDAGLVNIRRMDSYLQSRMTDHRIGVYVVDGSNITPQALEEVQNSLRILEFVPRGRARLAVSFNFELRSRAAEVGTIEPEAAELTRENLKKGDVIVKYDGETLIDFDHLTRITRKHEVGDRLLVEVRRNGEPVEFEIELTGWRKPEKKSDNAPEEK
jgi:hypothetical protein